MLGGSSKEAASLFGLLDKQHRGASILHQSQPRAFPRLSLSTSHVGDPQTTTYGLSLKEKRLGYTETFDALSYALNQGPLVPQGLFVFVRIRPPDESSLWDYPDIF